MWFQLRHTHRTQVIRQNVLAGANRLLGVFRSDWFESSRWMDFLDVLWPPHCAACGQFMSDEARSAGSRPLAVCVSASDRRRADVARQIASRLQSLACESAQPAADAGCLLCWSCLTRLTHDVACACRRCGAPVGPSVPAGRDVTGAPPVVAGDQTGADRMSDASGVGTSQRMPASQHPPPAEAAAEAPAEARPVCGRCRSESWLTDGVFRIGVYRQELRRACLACKLSAGGELTRALGTVLFATHLHDWAGLGIDAVVPVPQHWTARLTSADHPATVLARCLSRQLRVPCWDRCLVRVRRGQRQRRLTADERRANVSGSFRVRSGTGLERQTLLLVDDILTTGATVNELCRVLRLAGVRRVYAAVLARGLPAKPLWKVGRPQESGGASTGIPTAGPADLSATALP